MSTKIIDLPITKGIVFITNIWKTKIQIQRIDKRFVINTPKDMMKASLGDVYMVEKMKYQSGGQTMQRLKASKVKTYMVELLPLKTKKDMKILMRGNGLLKIKIEQEEYIIKESDTVGLEDLKINESTEVIYENDRIWKYLEPISENELFT